MEKRYHRKHSIYIYIYFQPIEGEEVLRSFQQCLLVTRYFVVNATVTLKLSDKRPHMAYAHRLTRRCASEVYCYYIHTIVRITDASIAHRT